MGAFTCVGGCGATVSKKNGRCRTCAGLLRRKKRAGRPAASPRGGPAPESPPLGRSGAQIARHHREASGTRGVAVVKDGMKIVTATTPPLMSVLTVGEALKAAGFAVAEVRVTEATVLVRLTA